MNSNCFKLYRAYSISFNSYKCWPVSLELNSKALYQSSGKKKESCRFVLPSSTKREIRHFHVVCRATTAKKCTKKRDARAKLLFCQSKPIGIFTPFSLPSPSSLLKLPINQGRHYCLFCCYLPAICIWREKKLYHGQDFRNFFFHQKQTCIWSGVKGISDLK